MGGATWCDQHNLPRPKDGRVPAETGRYLTVCLYRRPNDVPPEVMSYVLFLLGGVLAEA